VGESLAKIRVFCFGYFLFKRAKIASTFSGWKYWAAKRMDIFLWKYGAEKWLQISLWKYWISRCLQNLSLKILGRKLVAKFLFESIELVDACKTCLWKYWAEKWLQISLWKYWVHKFLQNLCLKTLG
jgi:hypothetical protein